MALPELSISPQVAEALETGRPVVALESSILAHGLPSPTNLETAGQMEQAVRDSGAVPATVAVIAGRVRVGLDPGQLDRLGTGRGVFKASARDLAWAVAAGKTAAATVSATVAVAHLAGIGIMATGGIGGVHRGCHEDVSADLTELARRPVTVVCAGPKAITDAARTAERLETLGVPVIGYRTADLPGFFVTSTGLPVDNRVEEVGEAAAVIVAARRLLPHRGLLLVQAPPASLALPAAELERLVGQAMTVASGRGVRGKQLTPFLLEQLHQLSGGRTLRLNQQLAVNNAALAGRVAVALGDAAHL